MIGRRAVLAAAWTILFAGPALVGPAVQAVIGHSQLVTSTPGSGEVVATSPTELRLVFSEPIDGQYTHLDLLDANGAAVARAIGSPDPADRYSLVAPISPLPDGLYTVDWQALSAADGHTTSGFFTFGVGAVTAPVAVSGGGTGSLHSGHDAGTTFLETESRFVGDVGFLLAFGLPIVAWFVLRERGSRGIARLIVGALVAGSIGAAGLLVIAAITPGLDVIVYATTSRSGVLLLARTALGLVGAILVYILRRDRPTLATVLGGIVGLGGLILIAAGGHAAAYASVAPVAAVIVHLIAAGIWLTGLLTILWLALPPGRHDQPLRTYVSRFSALALISVPLIALSGVYSDWIQTRSLISIATPYETTLAIKIALALGAFALGGFHYLTLDRGHRFERTVSVESALATLVLVATGVLASGSPPGQEQPIAIAPAVSSATSVAVPPIFELAPGRPGPTRFVAVIQALPADDTVELELQRLDTGAQTRIPLKPDATAGEFAADGGQLAPDSQWDASIVVRAADGTETARSRYTFALDSSGVSEGRQAPPIDPALVVALALLVLAVLGITFTLAGGTLPRVDPATSREALLAGSTLGAALGVLLLVGGPRL